MRNLLSTAADQWLTLAGLLIALIRLALEAWKEWHDRKTAGSG